MCCGYHLASLLRNVNEDIVDLVKIRLCHVGNRRKCVLSCCDLC